MSTQYPDQPVGASQLGEETRKTIPEIASVQAGYPLPIQEGFIAVNRMQMHYVEAGNGEPLLLLHGGTQSVNGLWAGHLWSWATHFPFFAEHFRVIAPDARGHGQTINPTGELSYPLLADDLHAFIHVLGLKRPFVCGFSDGGVTAALLEIRHPGSARALVNDAGFDLVTPEVEQELPPSRTTQPDIDYFVRMFTEVAGPDWFRLFQQDYDSAQGSGYWHTYLTQAPSLWNTSCGYRDEDFRKIEVPTLILVGDRDRFCSVESASVAYRFLPYGELGILPNTGHALTPLVCTLALDFLLRNSRETG